MVSSGAVNRPRRYAPPLSDRGRLDGGLDPIGPAADGSSTPSAPSIRRSRHTTQSVAPCDATCWRTMGSLTTGRPDTHSTSLTMSTDDRWLDTRTRVRTETRREPAPARRSPAPGSSPAAEAPRTGRQWRSGRFGRRASARELPTRHRRTARTDRPEGLKRRCAPATGSDRRASRLPHSQDRSPRATAATLYPPATIVRDPARPVESDVRATWPTAVSGPSAGRGNRTPSGTRPIGWPASQDRALRRRTPATRTAPLSRPAPP